jgi:hypothetical protein
LLHIIVANHVGNIPIEREEREKVSDKFLDVVIFSKYLHEHLHNPFLMQYL